MNCQNCNKKISPNDKFCEFCGIKIKKNIKHNIKYKRCLIFLVVFFGVCVIFSGMYLHQKNKIADCVLKNIGEPPVKLVGIGRIGKWETMNYEELLEKYESKVKKQKEICGDLYGIF